MPQFSSTFNMKVSQVKARLRDTKLIHKHQWSGRAFYYYHLWIVCSEARRQATTMRMTMMMSQRHRLVAMIEVATVAVAVAAQ